MSHNKYFNNFFSRRLYHSKCASREGNSWGFFIGYEVHNVRYLPREVFFFAEKVWALRKIILVLYAQIKPTTNTSLRTTYLYQKRIHILVIRSTRISIPIKCAFFFDVYSSIKYFFARKKEESFARTLLPTVRSPVLSLKPATLPRTLPRYWLIRFNFNSISWSQSSCFSAFTNTLFPFVFVT